MRIAVVPRGRIASRCSSCLPPASGSRPRPSARACGRSCATRAAFAVEASAVELSWVFGPPLVLSTGALFSTGAALAGAGLVLLASTTAFAAHPSSRAWRPAPHVSRPRGGSLRTPAMRTLALVLLRVGVLFGAAEIGVATASDALGATAAAGPLLGVWGVGSLAGGALRRERRAGTPRRARARASRWARRCGCRAAPRCRRSPHALLLALTAAHLALVAAAGSVFALAAVLFLAGAAIAPTYAAVFALVERAAPAGTVTEAFAWLATAVAVGSAGRRRDGGRDRRAAPARRRSSRSRRVAGGLRARSDRCVALGYRGRRAETS